MGKRIVILMGMVTAVVLLIVGVAAAAGGPAPSEDLSPPSSSTTAVITDTTASSTDTTAPVTDTTAMAGDGTTTEVERGDEPTVTSCAHPDNFGGTISSLRHAGDHTPAAVIKGKTVPGWSKKHPEATTTQTTTTVAPLED